MLKSLTIPTVVTAFWFMQIEATTDNNGRFIELGSRPYISKALCEEELAKTLDMIARHNAILRPHGGTTIEVHNFRCLKKN